MELKTSFLMLILLASPSLVFGQEKEDKRAEKDSHKIEKTATIKGTVKHSKTNNKRLSGVLVIVRALEGEKVRLPKKGVLDSTVNGSKPFALVVGEGGSVTFRNKRPELCNFKASNPVMRVSFNEGLSSGGTFAKVFPKAGFLTVSSSCHASEKSWIVVLKDAHYAWTDAKGNFEIKGLKAGKRRIEFWHGQFPVMGEFVLKGIGKTRPVSQRLKVTLKAGEVKELTVEPKSFIEKKGR